MNRDRLTGPEVEFLTQVRASDRFGWAHPDPASFGELDRLRLRDLWRRRILTPSCSSCAERRPEIARWSLTARGAQALAESSPS